MISRKERRIQKALGTEGTMPLTVLSKIKCRGQDWWHWHIFIKCHEIVDRLWMQFIWKLPKKFIYYSTIRIWAHATTLSSYSKYPVYDTTIVDALDRWEEE